MRTLVRILRAGHCRSTHHHFAIDSSAFVDTTQGRRLAALLLRHHENYLAGATDPDERFRDFQNHVVHVSDGYWGGAPRLAMTWYERLCDYLVHDRFGDAAYAAGVLSHYFTDPLQPLHTDQSEREPQVHRAFERSVRHCYGELLQAWRDDAERAVFHFGDGEGWLAEAIFRGARFAHQSYRQIVDGYDLAAGNRRPAEGLSPETRRCAAQLIGLAVTGLARIWERAAEEAAGRRGTPLPAVSLWYPTGLAALQGPEKRFLRFLHDRREAAEVRRVVAELHRTGGLVDNLPPECYIKHQVWLVRRRELAWQAGRKEPEQCSGEAERNILPFSNSGPIV